MTAELLKQAIEEFHRDNPKLNGMFFFQSTEPNEDNVAESVAIHVGILEDALEVCGDGLVSHMRKTLTPQSAAATVEAFSEFLLLSVRPLTIVTDAQNN